MKKGKEKVTFRSRHLQERKTIAAGFVGIGWYPEDMRRRLVTVVPPGPWKSAFFILPNVGDAQEIGIGQVDLELRLRKGNDTHSTQVAVWKPADGWTGIGGAAPRTLVAFGLMDLYQQDPTLANMKFETVTQITLKNDVLRVTDTMPVDDQRAIVTPLSAVKVLRLDTTSLSWAGLEPTSKLVSAMVTCGRATDPSTRWSSPAARLEARASGAGDLDHAARGPVRYRDDHVPSERRIHDQLGAERPEPGVGTGEQHGSLPRPDRRGLATVGIGRLALVRAPGRLGMRLDRSDRRGARSERSGGQRHRRGSRPRAGIRAKPEPRAPPRVPRVTIVRPVTPPPPPPPPTAIAARTRMFVASGGYDVQRWFDLSEAPASLQAAPRGTIVLARDLLLSGRQYSLDTPLLVMMAESLRIRGKSTIDVSARAAGKPAGAVMLLARRIMCDAGGSLRIISNGAGPQGDPAGGAGGDSPSRRRPAAAAPRASPTWPRAGPGSRTVRDHRGPKVVEYKRSVPGGPPGKARRSPTSGGRSKRMRLRGKPRRSGSSSDSRASRSRSTMPVGPGRRSAAEALPRVRGLDLSPDMVEPTMRKDYQDMLEDLNQYRETAVAPLFVEELTVQPAGLRRASASSLKEPRFEARLRRPTPWS